MDMKEIFESGCFSPGWNEVPEKKFTSRKEKI